MRQSAQGGCWRIGFTLFLLCLLSCSLGISYTVQVVALSDQRAALELRRSLNEQGYPVYLVSTPIDGGFVSRIRIGAFGNRAAAVSFAETFSEVEGSMPAPALAEGIPAGLIPLEPELLASYPFIPWITQLQVIPWDDGAALRFQGSFEGEPMQATYRVLEPDLVREPFDAWRAEPAEDGDIVRIYNFELWPSPEATGDPEAFEAYKNSLLATVAASLDISPDELGDYIFHTPGAGMPYIVLAERFDPVTGANSRYDAVGNPRQDRGSPSGPPLVWLGSDAPAVFPVGLPEPLLDLEELLRSDSNPDGVQLPEPDTWQVTGDGWTAKPDGAYTRLTLDEGGKSWRALTGFPIWAHGDYLLTYHDGEILLYTFERR